MDPVTIEDIQLKLQVLISEVDLIKEGLLILNQPKSRQYMNVSLPGLPGTLRRVIPSRKIAFCSACNKPTQSNDHKICITQHYKCNRNRWEAALYLASID